MLPVKTCSPPPLSIPVPIGVGGSRRNSLPPDKRRPARAPERERSRKLMIIGPTAYTLHMRHLTLALIAILSFSLDAAASVTRLRIERREIVLNGRPFGAAGAYEKLSGKVDFALDPALPQNRGIVDLNLAPKNAQGLVEFSADFYLLKPVDPARGNGRLFYEAGNRGTKRILPVFQDAANSADPTTEAEFGNGALMRQGFTLLWMGWQWDVPEGRMRMEIPIATNNGQPSPAGCAATSFPARVRQAR